MLNAPPLDTHICRIACLCLALASMAIAMDPAAAQDFRLDDQVEPAFEAVELRLDPEQTSYSGTVHIELQPREETTSFRLHAQEM